MALEEIAVQQKKERARFAKDKPRLVADIKRGVGMYSFIEHTMAQYSDDPDIVAALVTRSEDGAIFGFASERLRNDAAFVLELMKAEPNILRFAGQELRRKLSDRISEKHRRASH